MQVHIADALVKGILVGLFMAMSVGPTVFAIIRYSLSFSYRAGYAFVLGVSVSDIMYVTIANVAAQWLQVLKPYEKYIAVGGGIALAIMGIAGLVKKLKTANTDTPAIIGGGHYFKIWLSGFLINTLNPGVLITWLGAVTITLDTPGLYRFILFGTCLAIILSIDFLKIFLAEKLKQVLTPKRIHYMHRFSSACLLGIGLFLVISTVVNSTSNKPPEKNGIDNILSH